MYLCVSSSKPMCQLSNKCFSFLSDVLTIFRSCAFQRSMSTTNEFNIEYGEKNIENG